MNPIDWRSTILRWSRWPSPWERGPGLSSWRSNCSHEFPDRLSLCSRGRGGFQGEGWVGVRPIAGVRAASRG